MCEYCKYKRQEKGVKATTTDDRSHVFCTLYCFIIIYNKLTVIINPYVKKICILKHIFCGFELDIEECLFFLNVSYFFV